jgi:hypothetical protein
LPPGDADAALASDAITVMDGLALCEEHIDWVVLPQHHIEEIERLAKLEKGMSE